MRTEQEHLEIRGILSKNVKEQRKKLRLTLEELAELTGLAVQTINDIEGGRRWVSDKTITKLSSALHIESYQLLIADFFSQDAMKEAPIHRLLDLKKKILKNVDSQIEAQFDDFFQSGALHPDTELNEAHQTPLRQQQARKEPATKKPNQNRPKVR